MGQNEPVMEWLAEYGLFLAKAVTVVVAACLAVGLAAGLAAGVARRGHGARRHGPSFEITHLNRRYRDMVAAFERITTAL